jgi:hypothetical protein
MHGWGYTEQQYAAGLPDMLAASLFHCGSLDRFRRCRDCRTTRCRDCRTT